MMVVYGVLRFDRLRLMLRSLICVLVCCRVVLVDVVFCCVLLMF